MTAGEFIAHWIMCSRNGRLILKGLEAAAFVLGMVIMGWVLYMVETRFFPVVTGWKLEYIEKRDGQYHMGGVLRKERACELIATDVMAVPKMPLLPRQSIYRIKPFEFPGAQVATGYTQWGPWDMDIPAAFTKHRDQIAFIEVVGIHRCHAFWMQETVYGRIRTEDLP